MPRSTRAAERTASASAPASPGGTAAGRASRGRRRTQPVAYLYVLPAFVIFAVFLGVPFLQTVQYSFFHWDGLSLATWAGLSNYVDVFTDRELRSAFAHALVLMVFYSVVPITIALFLTALISRANRLRGMSVYRTVLFLPQVIASVVVATIWVSIYSADGLLNSFLRLIGLDSITRVWLGDYDFALIAIGFVGTWLNIGLCLVLFLSGVGNIQPALFEAARHRRGERRTGVLRRHPARPARPDRRGPHPDPRLGAEDLRPGLRDHGRRTRQLHDGAGLRGVQPGLQHRPGRLGGRGGDLSDHRDHDRHGRDQPAAAQGDGVRSRQR